MVIRGEELQSGLPAVHYNEYLEPIEQAAEYLAATEAVFVMIGYICPEQLVMEIRAEKGHTVICNSC